MTAAGISKRVYQPSHRKYNATFSPKQSLQEHIKVASKAILIHRGISTTSVTKKKKNTEQKVELEMGFSKEQQSRPYLTSSTGWLSRCFKAPQLAHFLFRYSCCVLYKCKHINNMFHISELNQSEQITEPLKKKKKQTNKVLPHAGRTRSRTRFAS